MCRHFNILVFNFQQMRSQFQLSAFSFQLFIFGLPLAWLWLVLINDLRVEWTVNPQYGYGWAVPFLCVFLVWQRIQKAESRKQKVETHFSFQLSKFQLFALALCALLYAPTRLIEEANPGWRLVSWALAIEVVGLTLLAVNAALKCGVRSAECGEFLYLHFQRSSVSAFQILSSPSASSSWPFPGRRTSKCR